MEPPVKELDLFRHTPIRYLGYTNEVGEAFRAIIGPKWVTFTYGIATVYVLADTGHKSINTYLNHSKTQDRLKKTLHITGDTLLWQMLASVIIPGLTINRICAISHFFLKKNNKVPERARKLAVTSIGLLAIPFIIKPIDKLVDHVLDSSYRKYTT